LTPARKTEFAGHRVTPFAALDETPSPPPNENQYRGQHPAGFTRGRRAFRDLAGETPSDEPPKSSLS